MGRLQSMQSANGMNGSGITLHRVQHLMTSTSHCQHCLRVMLLSRFSGTRHLQLIWWPLKKTETTLLMLKALPSGAWLQVHMVRIGPKVRKLGIRMPVPGLS